MLLHFDAEQLPSYVYIYIYDAHLNLAENDFVMYIDSYTSTST